MDDHSALPFRIRYDRESDVLYLSTRPGVPALSREDGPGLIWRHDAEHGDLIGLTVIDFCEFWGDRRAELISRIADRFHVSSKETGEMLNCV